MGRRDDTELERLENDLMLFGGLLRDTARAITQLNLHNLDLAMIDLLDIHDQLMAKKFDAKLAYDEYQAKKSAVCGANGAQTRAAGAAVENDAHPL